MKEWDSHNQATSIMEENKKSELFPYAMFAAGSAWVRVLQSGNA